MIRLLNTTHQVCGNFYYDDRALQKMLNEVIEKFNLPQDCRVITFPRGHFHISPILVGGILFQNFHFIFHLQSEEQRAIIDVYCKEEPENRIEIAEIIRTHCQAAAVETMPLRSSFAEPVGNYVSFQTKPLDFSKMIDRLHLLGNFLNLGPSLSTLIVPPPGLENRGYDILQIFAQGYFAVHDTGDFPEVDILIPQKMSKDNIENWFQECREPRFLLRTFW